MATSMTRSAVLVRQRALQVLKPAYKLLTFLCGYTEAGVPDPGIRLQGGALQGAAEQGLLRRATDCDVGL